MKELISRRSFLKTTEKNSKVENKARKPERSQNEGFHLQYDKK
jgi:hypothetical protein